MWNFNHLSMLTCNGTYPFILKKRTGTVYTFDPDRSESSLQTQCGSGHGFINGLNAAGIILINN
jgi:hypothetical protein